MKQKKKGKMNRDGRGAKNEKLWNIPNALTFSRIILTFVALYFIFAAYPLQYVVIVFILGMITDFLDGQIARRFHMETEFGRKFDIIADRFLMLSVVGGLLHVYTAYDVLTKQHIFLIFITLTREIISFPFALIAFVARAPIPEARYIGKLTTFLQGCALPAILLSVVYPYFGFAPLLAYVTGLIGIISAFVYINDLRRLHALGDLT